MNVRTRTCEIPGNRPIRLSGKLRDGYYICPAALGPNVYCALFLRSGTCVANEGTAREWTHAQRGAKHVRRSMSRASRANLV